MVTEIKKVRVTYEQVALKDCHPKPSSLNDNGVSWKNRGGKSLILGIKLKWTDYNNVPQESKKVLVTYKGLKDVDIDTFIQNQITKPFETLMRNNEVARLQNDIEPSNSYKS